VAFNTDVITASDPGAGGLTKGERVGGIGEGMKEGGVHRVEVERGREEVCRCGTDIDIGKDTK
jgi:hypothetical protein